MKYFTWIILFKLTNSPVSYECLLPHFTEEETHVIGKILCLMVWNPVNQPRWALTCMYGS